jgi:hypothetical protein
MAGMIKATPGNPALTSPPRLDRWRSLRFAGCALALCASAACTQRLDANFDRDPLGAPPTFPAPTPPNDSLAWRTSFAAPVVVANPAGGKWLRVTPAQAHLASPDDRRVFLIADSERISAAGGKLAGIVVVRLDGPGTLGIGVRPVSRTDYLGAVEVSNFLPPAGGGVHAMRPFTGAMLTGFLPLPPNAPLSGYATGDVVEIHWTINQSTRTFSVNVQGGPSVSNVFPAIGSENLPMTPIAGVQVVLWLERPTSETVAFVDDLSVDEWRPGVP